MFKYDSFTVDGSRISLYIGAFRSRAQMAELVDALRSGRSSRKGVEVRVLFWAPDRSSERFFFVRNSLKNKHLLEVRRHFVSGTMRVCPFASGVFAGILAGSWGEIPSNKDPDTRKKYPHEADRYPHSKPQKGGQALQGCRWWRPVSPGHCHRVQALAYALPV